MQTLTRRVLARGALAIALCAPAFAGAEPPQEAPKMSAEQQAMMDAWQKASTPGAEHKQLAEQFAGTWTTKQTMWMDPSAPPMSETGKAVNTALFGGRQVRMEFSGGFMGQPFEGIGYTGYDNVRKRYTSFWADSMGTGSMNLLGDYDAATKTYSFTGDMPDVMKPGGMLAIRETVRIVDADHMVMEMFEPHDGKEVRTMQIEYTRAK